MAFVKLDTGILNSTLWFERDQREVFITALLMAEPREFTEPVPQIDVGKIEYTGFIVPPGWYGFVPAASFGIINRAGVDRESGIEAIRRLGEPEMESRSKDFDGRRMIRVDGGFLILNYMKYRDKDYTSAVRAKNLRERKKSGIDVLLQEQGGKCACCEGAFERPFSKYVVQDHNHKTGEIRGLVCQSCNAVVGLIENGKKTESPKESLCRSYIKRYGVST
jgi:hypothetical protein